MLHTSRGSLLVLSVLATVAFIASDSAAQDAPPASRPAWPALGTGPLPQVRAFDWLIGTWDVNVKWFAPPPSDQTFSAPTTAAIEPMLSGSFLRETIAVPFGKLTNHMVGVRSYDRFRETYRLVWFDELVTLCDVYEGGLTDGRLVLTNLKSGTAYVGDDRVETFVRITEQPGPSRDEFTLIWEASTDKGKSWRKTCEYAYKRKP
jgi:hypothetical protein